MGQIASCIDQWSYTGGEAIYNAAHDGNATALRDAVRQLNRSTRCYAEWKEPCFGRTPLAGACVRGHVECVQILLRVARCTATDHHGNSPLHLASRHGRPKVVEMLLDHPTVNILQVNCKNQTALDLVRAKMRNGEKPQNARDLQECIEYLEKKLCIYIGWMYEKTGNMLSAVTGMDTLHSWNRCYCLVLSCDTRDKLELDLYHSHLDLSRPSCPTSVIFVKPSYGIIRTIDNKWFNVKELSFTLLGTRDRMSTINRYYQFAALDTHEFRGWKNYFDSYMRVPRVQVRAHRTRNKGKFKRKTKRMHGLLLERETQDSQQMPVSAPPMEIEYSAEREVEMETKPAVPPPSYENQCFVCFDGPQSAVCVPCGHNATCMTCAEQIMRSTKICPLCRGNIREVIRLYRA